MVAFFVIKKMVHFSHFSCFYSNVLILEDDESFSFGLRFYFPEKTCSANYCLHFFMFGGFGGGGLVLGGKVGVLYLFSSLQEKYSVHWIYCDVLPDFYGKAKMYFFTSN